MCQHTLFPHYASEAARGTDLTVFSRIRIGSRSSFIRRCGSRPDPDLILLITFKFIVDVCQNIRQNVQSVVAYWRNRIRPGTFLIGPGSVPDLLICGSGHLCYAFRNKRVKQLVAWFIVCKKSIILQYWKRKKQRRSTSMSMISAPQELHRWASATGFVLAQGTHQAETHLIRLMSPLSKDETGRRCSPVQFLWCCDHRHACWSTLFFPFSFDSLWFPAHRCDISGTLVVPVVVFLILWLLFTIAHAATAITQLVELWASVQKVAGSGFDYRSGNASLLHRITMGRRLSKNFFSFYKDKFCPDLTYLLRYDILQ